MSVMRSNDIVARRRGSMYVIALATSIAVTVIGLSALAVVRVERDIYAGSGDRVSARFLARTGIEMALHDIESDTAWRSNRVPGTWITNRLLNGGRFSVIATDPIDANFANNDGDPVLLTGIGIFGPATYKMEVEAQAKLVALTCIDDVTWCAGTDLTFASGSTTTADKMMAANNIATALKSAIVNADVEAVNKITGLGFTRNTVVGVIPRTLPDPTTVFDYYVTNGTAISVASLPIMGGGYRLERIVLSPASNPYGTTNAQGIYVIDCGGASIYVSTLRIVGTLVLLNAGLNSSVSDAINWEPAVANLPTLLVQGNLAMTFSASAKLNESMSNANYNPIGTPYLEISDSLMDDIYPTVMNGLIYASGNLAIGGTPNFAGLAISGGSSSFSGTVNVTYQNTYRNDPPPGFYEIARMKPSSGTFQRVVN